MTPDRDDIRMDPWATHLPALLACVAHTMGPVLELGCGVYSTPVLHAACAGRHLVSVDRHAPWVQRFAHMRSKDHAVICAPDGAELAAHEWDVVLVDSTPAQGRIEEIARLRATSRLLVIHDTEPGRPVYRYDQILPSFPHARVWDREPTWTTIVSDVDDLAWLEGLL